MMRGVLFVIFCDYQALFVIFVITKLYFFLLYAWLCAHLLVYRCERVGVVYSLFVSCEFLGGGLFVEGPWWT